MTDNNNSGSNPPPTFTYPTYQNNTAGTNGPNIVGVPITTSGNTPGTWTITFPSATWISAPNVITSAPPLGEVVCEPVEEKEVEEGATCRRCNEWNEYAAADRDDGTFVCYKCSHGL